MPTSSEPLAPVSSPDMMPVPGFSVGSGSGWGGAGSWPVDSSLLNLREQVKQLQRGDPTGREQWVAYCDTFGGGKHDPGKHDETFISAFLGQYASGARLDTSGSDSAIQMVTKMLQRKSTSLKEVWAQYCAMYGGGKSDPMKHDTEFHVSFYDQVCAMVTGGQVGSSFGNGQYFGNGPHFDNGPSFGTGPSFGNGPSFGSGPNPGGMDPEKATMVNRIKAYQRSDPMHKEAWDTFCNSLGDSTHTKNPTKDPARHEVSALQMFVQQYGVS